MGRCGSVDCDKTRSDNLSASAEMGTQLAFVAKSTEQVMELRAQGLSFRQIGAKMGVSHAAAHRWYKAGRGEQLQRIERLRETAFYRDLATIQDKLDALEADWAVTDDDCLPKLAAIVKLLEVKAKFLRYSDLEFNESTATRSRDDLIKELATQTKTLGERMAASVVVDVGSG